MRERNQEEESSGALLGAQPKCHTQEKASCWSVLFVCLNSFHRHASAFLQPAHLSSETPDPSNPLPHLHSLS